MEFSFQLQFENKHYLHDSDLIFMRKEAQEHWLVM